MILQTKDTGAIFAIRSLAVAGLVILALSLPLAPNGMAQPERGRQPQFFVYVSDQRIITTELAGENKVVLNYINLSDVIELMEAQGLLVVDEAGNGYRGHLFLREDPGPSENRYEVNDLLKPGEFRAFDIVGNFRWKSPPAHVYLQLGSRLAELEPIDSAEFDVFATKVAQLDLSEESRVAVVEAGFWRGQGLLHQAGSEESTDVEQRFPIRDPAPPIPLDTPAGRLPEKFSNLPDPVVVQLRVHITDEGGILNPGIARGVTPELDQLAIQIVQNSWHFLPAVSRGKTVGAETVLNVQFQRP